MRAVVLAAGFGTRLGGLTAETPKPLLDVGGVSLIECVVAQLVACGFEELAVNLHFRGELIRERLGDGGRLGARIVYSPEPELLGTAGALRPLRQFLAGDAFLVHYGDVLTDHDFRALAALHRARDALVTLLVHRRAGSNSVVELDDDGRVTTFLERPDTSERGGRGETWVNSGVCVCAPAVLDLLPAGPADLPRDVIVPLVSTRRVFAQPLEGFRAAVDSPERLEEARAAVAAGRWRPRSTMAP